jgi:anti-anti-sigma regulatory factor
MERMSNGSAQFSAYGNDELALVRVEGPGVCRDSGRFENLLRAVEARHYRYVVVDLSECPRMDSTFAGALLRLADRTVGSDAGSHSIRVAVAGAHGPVSDLLDTLCLNEVFESVEIPEGESLEALPIKDQDLPRDEIMALSVDSHERLSALNEANRKRFSALLPMLRKELEKKGDACPAPEVNGTKDGKGTQANSGFRAQGGSD